MRRLGNRVKTYDEWKALQDICPEEVDIIMCKQSDDAGIKQDLLSVNDLEETTGFHITKKYALTDCHILNKPISDILEENAEQYERYVDEGPNLCYLFDNNKDFAILVTSGKPMQTQTLYYQGGAYRRQNGDWYWNPIHATVLKDSVGTDKIQNDAITEDKIQNDAVTEDKIQNEAITSTKINKSAILDKHLSADIKTRIDKNKFDDTLFIWSVEEFDDVAKFSQTNFGIYRFDSNDDDSSLSGILITSWEFDSFNNVNRYLYQTILYTTGKIFTRQYTVSNKTWSDWAPVNNGAGAEIADNSISTSKIQNGAVTKEKLHKDLINELNGDILNNSIDGSKIMDKAIESRHLSSEVAGSININKFDRTIEEFEIDNYAYSYSEPSTIYKVAGSHLNLEGGILIVSNEIESPTHLKNINNTYIKHSGEILTRYAITTGDLLSPPSWSEWKSIYVTNTLMDEHKLRAVLDHEDGSVTTEKIADEAITDKKIRHNSISGEHLMPMSITNRELDADAVRTSRIQDGAVTSSKIANSAITSEKMAENSVKSTSIEDRAINGDKIRPLAVETKHIDIGAVTESRLSDNAVTTNKIANDTVTSDKIQINAIRADHITDKSIKTRHVEPGAITASQLDNNLYNKIVNNTFDGVIETNAIDDYEFPIQNGVLIYKLNDSNIANDYGGLLLVYAHYAKRSNSSTGETKYTLETMRQAKILIGTGQVYTRYASRSATTKPSKWSEWAQVIVGKKIENGGEIFNDYENNQATLKNSHVEGNNNSVKILCYPGVRFNRDSSNNNITNVIVAPSGSWDSEITPGMCVSTHVEGYKYRGKIESISGDLMYLDSTDSATQEFMEVTSVFDLIVAGGKYGTQLYNSEEFSAHVEGSNNFAGINAHAEGCDNEATGFGSHVEGRFGKAHGEYSHVEGYENIAEGHVSHVEGIKNISSGAHDHAEGYMNEASGGNSHVEGSANKSIGPMSHAEGYMNEASGEMAHVEGYKNNAIGDYSHAEGNENWSTGKRAHVEGYSNRASGENAHSEGEGNSASGYNSHAEGINNSVSSSASHAEGNGNTVTGEIAHAEGGGNTASAKAAHAEGYLNTASGAQSHAEGRNTKATGAASHSEGLETQANGGNAHAEGYKTIANSSNSHAEGDRTIASSANQHVQGKFNVEDTENKYAHIVGGGTSDKDRKNIHTVDWDGNAWFAGDMEVSSVVIRSSTPGSNKKFKLTIDDTGTISVSEI